ncbi:hypothetical protein BAZSYMA_ACONTIG29723_1 [Bathymodiolus azoricus thioautotrophic gill symbiont]|uniref:Uncharacterized protein n=1 Tax=Bathymodiolus azoricus thioautotrophic gill symbiont TaxID=235205 RepID=A0A1H6LYD9_9GAMM|nr:hypothetical protein BAZSYMA_ACONTIG29723_1 [Bathymodiolus azoricus thioautotrophic gill symbiont]
MEVLHLWVEFANLIKSGIYRHKKVYFYWLSEFLKPIF